MLVLPPEVEVAGKEFSSSHYDTVIIGCGMSGLGAGIRLAMYDRKVLILERHNAPGGLNSFYFLGGRKCDVGLHALTNFGLQGSKGPLTKIFRQLRIQRDEFELCPQKGSRILFPDAQLRFSNGIDLLESEVARVFPASIDAFRDLVQHIGEFDALAPDAASIGNARAILAERFKEPLLVEMLLCPILYYGSPKQNDIDWESFCVLFRALFLEGFARPFEGVRPIIRSLLRRYKEVGGERKMKCGVRRLITNGARVEALELDTGEVITADHVISSAGAAETWAMLEPFPSESLCAEKDLPRLTFAETMTFFAGQPEDRGWEDTIVFFNTGKTFTYAQPEEPVDLRSGVICLPNNYEYAGRQLSEGILRVTSLANYDTWKNATEEEYRLLKEKCYARMAGQAEQLLNRVSGAATPEPLEKSVTFTDMFTPRTIEKFTGHIGGSVYGSPLKRRDGITPLENLYLCGTDQGYLGIVGAILSGVSIANARVLSA